MKIYDPQNPKFAPETLNLFEEIQTVISEINARRPFSPEVQDSIKTEFLPDRVTASLNIEGISVSRRQTLLMMDAMTLSENSSKSEIEVLNALKADELVIELSSQNNPLTASAVRDINAQLQKGVLDTAGQYRKKMLRSQELPSNPQFS